MKSNLTHSELTDALCFDEKTGVFTRLKTSSVRKGLVGKESGSKDERGYLRIMVNKKTYKSHRLAWFYVHGVWPKNEIDHINGCKSDNRIENLRDVTREVNTQNLRSSTAGSKTNVIGVSPVSGRTDKFDSQIHANGKKISLCTESYGGRLA